VLGDGCGRVNDDRVPQFLADVLLDLMYGLSLADQLIRAAWGLLQLAIGQQPVALVKMPRRSPMAGDLVRLTDQLVLG